MKWPLKTHHLGKVRWRQTDGHRNGGEQLPAPQGRDEPFSPGMGRVGVCPRGPTPACGLCSGGCSPAGILHPSAPSTMGVPVGQSPQQFPFPIPEGCRAVLPPAHTAWAVLWGTGVSAAPNGLSPFPTPPRPARLSLFLLPLVGKFDLSPLWSQHEELAGHREAVLPPQRTPSNPNQPGPALAPVGTATSGKPNALS